MGGISFSLETARASDAAEIALLLQRSIRELCIADHGNDPQKLDPWLANKTPDAARNWIAAPGRVICAAQCGVSARWIVGVAMGNETGEVLLNYVHPAARHCGISKALMLALEGYFDAMGCQKARLTSTKTAERFYRSIGYAEIGEPSSHRGMPVRSFEKDLTKA